MRRKGMPGAPGSTLIDHDHVGMAKYIRQGHPRVLVSLRYRTGLHAIIDLAREWGWDLLDLKFTRGAIPDNPPPQGAFVDCLPTDPLAKRLMEMGCPTVRLGRLPHPQDVELPAVLPDVMAAGRLALEHFVERGFMDVAFIAYDPTRSEDDCHSMYVAFRQQARERGLNVHVHELILGDHEHPESMADPAAKYERRVREVGAWLATLPKPVGVFTYSDEMAASVCTMCMASGLAVPETVAVLGVGNDPLVCELSPVDLSSIDTAADERGRQAALLLREMMKDRAKPPRSIIVPPRGVVDRRSTDVLAVPDPVVVRAMRFMWDHVDQNISVDDVAAAVGVQRRKLERAFRIHLKRGVNAELRRKRLERLRELLETTDLSIAAAGALVGYRSRDYLHMSFRKAYGVSPGVYRKTLKGKQQQSL